jgi:hypothetical protein
LKRQFLAICKRKRIKVNPDDWTKATARYKILVHIWGEKRDRLKNGKYSKWYDIDYIDVMTRRDLVEFVVKSNNRNSVMESFGEGNYIVLKKFLILVEGTETAPFKGKVLQELSFKH